MCGTDENTSVETNSTGVTVPRGKESGRGFQKKETEQGFVSTYRSSTYIVRLPCPKSCAGLVRDPSTQQHSVWCKVVTLLYRLSTISDRSISSLKSSPPLEGRLCIHKCIDTLPFTLPTRILDLLSVTVKVIPFGLLLKSLRQSS